MIDRRHLIVAPLVVLGGWPQPSTSQSGQRLPSVGFVALAARESALIEAFDGGLQEHGRMRGRDVAVEERYGGGSREGMRQQIAGLLGGGTRVFVAAGVNIAKMIQEQSQAAAVVVASLESLESAGISGTIARPDGNITGFATLGAELLEKRIELLREIKPHLGRIALVINPGNRNHLLLSARAREVGVKQMIRIEITEVARPEEAGIVLHKAKSAGAEAVMFVRDFLYESHREQLVAAANQAGLPSVFDEGAFVRLGGLMSYSPSRPDLFRRAAAYVVKILDGTAPADLPVQQPTKFELVVNLGTGKALGLTVPPSILIRADEVIE